MNIRQWVGGLLLLVSAAAAWSQTGPAPPPPASVAPAAASAASAFAALPVEPAASAPPVSLSARKVYEQARSQLVQIRTVLKGPGSQNSVGSGFFVSPQGHIVTNFHVVSKAALQPQRYGLVYTTADRRDVPLQLVLIDVLHDLALLRVAGTDRADFDALTFRTSAQPLAQGERMYSMGYPLDVGSAVIEGNYNGLVERSFYPQIFFAGSLSGGMSGGPALDQEGRVIGVNVARRVDGEQISFLIPGDFAAGLLARGRQSGPLKLPAWDVVAEQLMSHQEVLTERFIRYGWRSGTHPRYTVPVPVDRFMRCWGSNASRGGLEAERTDCVMDTRIFVGDFVTGNLSTLHESSNGRRLGALRFAARYSANFRSEPFESAESAEAAENAAPEQRSWPQCHEDFLDRNGLLLRAVVCMRAYKKLPKLYDVSVKVATLDQAEAGVQGRFEAQGLSHPNAVKLTRHYLEAYGWARSR